MALDGITVSNIVYELSSLLKGRAEWIKFISHRKTK